MSRGQKKIRISWLASTLLLMFIVAIAMKCWVGSMKELMKHPRSTRKESSYLKSQKLLRRTGSIPFCSPFYSCFVIVILYRKFLPSTIWNLSLFLLLHCSSSCYDQKWNCKINCLFPVNNIVYSFFWSMNIMVIYEEQYLVQITPSYKFHFGKMNFADM